MTTQATQLLFANNANTTITAGINSSVTSCSLAPGTGALFPSPSSGQAFKLTLTSASNPLLTEIVLVTAISGDNITTMVRGQEGTTAQAFNAGDYAANLLTAETAQSFVQAPAVLAGQVGALRGTSMFINPSASATTTVTANGFSQTINLAINGVGGMDTGSAPASSFVSIYAIANLNTGAVGLLACAVATSSGPTYTGANMPAGYTASQLLSIWPTNSGSLMIVGTMSNGRHDFVPQVALASGSATSYTLISLASYVPPGAKFWHGFTQVTFTSSNTTGSHFCRVSPIGTTLGQTGSFLNGISGTAGGAGFATPDIPIITAQQTYYLVDEADSVGAVDVTGYTI